MELVIEILREKRIREVNKRKGETRTTDLKEKSEAACPMSIK